MGTRKGIKRPDSSAKQSVHTEAGDNSKFIKFAMEAQGLNEFEPIDTSDEEQVRQRIMEYFDLAIEHDLKPTVAGLSSALGIDRTTFSRWCKGELRTASHSETAKKAKQVLEDVMEQYMMNGKINPVAGIFLMSNNFGYKQKVEVTAEVQQDPLAGRSAEELRARYADIIDVDAEEAESTRLIEQKEEEKIQKSAEGAESDGFDDF